MYKQEIFWWNQIVDNRTLKALFLLNAISLIHCLLVLHDIFALTIIIIEDEI